MSIHNHDFPPPGLPKIRNRSPGPKPPEKRSESVCHGVGIVGL